MSNLSWEDRGNITHKEYENIVNRLEKKIQELKNVGLINDNENLPPYAEILRPLLRSYLNSVEKKILEHQSFIQQLLLFKELVSYLDFSNKSFEINPKFGYRFVSKDNMKTKLMPSMLSSGEQHMLVQLYNLLFRTPQNSLVLIDEPEMSMHLFWQMNYQKVIEKVAKVKKLHCVIATHSNAIFGNMFSRTVDLYKSAKK